MLLEEETMAVQQTATAPRSMFALFLGEKDVCKDLWNEQKRGKSVERSE